MAKTTGPGGVVWGWPEGTDHWGTENDNNLQILDAAAASCADIKSPEFGAVGDGVTDDTAAFVAAIATGLPIRCEGGPFLVSGLTITVPIVDTISQIFSSGSTVTINNGLPVRPEWFGSAAGSIKLAVQSLPASGGVVVLRAIRYAWSGYGPIYVGAPAAPTPAQMLTKDNVTIRGARRPVKGGNSLVNGTVIEGPFGVWANNFQIYNLGIDSGPDTCSSRYGGVAQEGFMATYTNVETPSSGEKTGLIVDGLISLCKDPGAQVHAILIERYNGPEIGSIESYWGGHGVAIKSLNTSVRKITATLHGNDGVIIKSDGAAQGGMATAQNVTIGEILVNACPSAGLILQSGTNPLSTVRICRLMVIDTTGGTTSVAIKLVDEGGFGILDNIRIDEFIADKITYAIGQDTALIDIRRLSLGRVALSRASYAGIQIDTKSYSYPITIEQLEVDTVRRPVSLFGYAIARIGRIVETVAHPSETSVVECNGGSALAIGDYQVAAPLFPAGSFAFNGSWRQWPGGTASVCGIDVIGYKVRLRGLADPNGSASTHIATIAREFRPPKELFFPVLYTDGATVGVLQLLVKPDGTINLNTIPPGLVYVSLEGLEWG